MIKRILNQETLEEVSTNLRLQLDYNDIKLIEDEKDGKKSKKARICIIKAGWNTNGYYFSDENLQEILSLMEKRPKIYLNHDYFGFGRSEADWSASYLKTWKEEKALYGDIRFTDNPNTVWIYNEIKEDAKTVQFSIDIAATVEPMDNPDGSVGRKVVKVLMYRSTDIVSYAAAGGEAMKILNEKVIADIQNINSFIKKQKENEEMEIKSIADLKAQHPSLVEQLLNENKNSLATDQKIAQLETEVTNLKNSKATVDTEIEKLKIEKVALESNVTSLTAEKTTLVTERDGLKVKVDTFETSVKMANWEKDINKAIEDSQIDKKLISDVFLGQLKRLDKIEDVTKLIEDRKGLSATVINNGLQAGDLGKTGNVVVTDDLLVASIKG